MMFFGPYEKYGVINEVCGLQKNPIKMSYFQAKRTQCSLIYALTYEKINKKHFSYFNAFVSIFFF